MYSAKSKDFKEWEEEIVEIHASKFGANCVSWQVYPEGDSDLLAIGTNDPDNFYLNPLNPILPQDVEGWHSRELLQVWAMEKDRYT